MSDVPQNTSSVNSQQNVLQQILLQCTNLSAQQQSSQHGTQNIVLSVPVGSPRNLQRLSLTPSAAAVSPTLHGSVSPGVAYVSGSTSPLALQQQHVGRLQQAQQFVRVPSGGLTRAQLAVSSPQLIQNVSVTAGAAPPNVYMVAGSQQTVHQLAQGSPTTQQPLTSVQQLTGGVAPVRHVGSITPSQTTGQLSPRKHSSGMMERKKSPVAKVAAYVPSPKMSAPSRTIPSHSNSIVANKAEAMQKDDVKQFSEEQIIEMRNEILKQRRGILRELNAAYIERLTECFFLQRGGNMMDYVAWKKKVPNVTLENYLAKHKLEERPSRYSSSSSDLAKSVGYQSEMRSPQPVLQATPVRKKSDDSNVRLSVNSGAIMSDADGSRKRSHSKAGLDAYDFPDDSEGGPPPVKVPGSLVNLPPKASPVSPRSAQGQQNQLKVPERIRQKEVKMTPPGMAVTSIGNRRIILPTTTKQAKSPVSPGARDRLPTRQQSLSAVYDYSIGSQEMIVERAKQEAQVMQRIAELRKEGLWSAKRLPKVQEPPRHKTHWDYLLDEMQWLATDFSQERRWKKAAAKKLARAVAAYHRDKQAKEIKAERDEANRLRKIAANIAKEVKQFWVNIEKVVQYKQQSRLEEKRKKALDMQLDFIVGQTEKYSSWLTEGLNLSEKGSMPGSLQGSLSASPETSDVEQNDEEFRPVDDESDDEETIDVEEKAAEQEEESHAKELELLQKESEEPIEEILSKLPQEALEGDGNSTEDSKGEAAEGTDLKAVLSDDEDTSKDVSKDDEEFVVSADETEEEVVDDEDTIEEEEKLEGEANHKEELEDLQAEGEVPIEELLKKYAGAYDEDFEMPQSSEESEMDSDDESDDESEEEEAGEDDVEDGELKDVGMEYLLHPEKSEEQAESKEKTGSSDAGPNKEITDIAKTAESLQPTGYTLSDTQVTTKVPILLKHKLREYQHIGLDWLVTMHDKKLNGILADEMGLGKTIQTIALLAHLACEKSNWGPHLIVVPTSVMLNWEMEFKKWCPGFKILTYFGSQKERKQKRQGWTKQNAFHICITSYKLVIQDHASFRRKKWKYLVLDEAQNIKNFKSQRWQTLLNFNSQRRLLLTGTPLQNNLMELWSLMHFLMPHVFQSHREFREWFSNPLSGMIEGTQEYNEGLIKRLHKVLRPFLLRRLKSQVEKQLPQKYEHVVKCRLSKRQRFLYDDFMGRTKTKETLKTGQFLSVINVLMQLRKVCNHPDLFEVRPNISPFIMEGLSYHTASDVVKALDYHPLKHVSLANFNLCLADLELTLPAYIAHRTRQLQTPRKLIEEIDSIPLPPPRPPRLKMKPGKLLTPPGVAHVQRDKLPLGRNSPSLSSQQSVGRASPVRAASPSSRSVLRTASPHLQGRSSPGVTQVILRSPAGTPIPRQTSVYPHGLFTGAAQHTIIPSLSGGTFALVSNPNNPGTFTIVQHPTGVPSATPLQQLPGYMATSMGPLAQQRLLQQQQQQLVNQGIHVRQQPLVGNQPITVLQNQVNSPSRIANPLGQINQISRGGVIQLIQQSAGGVSLVNSTPISPPGLSQVPPQPLQAQLRSPSQPLVQVLQQPHQVHSITPRPQTIQEQLKIAAAKLVPNVPQGAQQQIARPQNIVSAAHLGSRVPMVAPQVNQTRPVVSQQLVQRAVQLQGVRPVGTVAPIQIVTTKPQTSIPPLTTVAGSSPSLQKPTVVTSVKEEKSLSHPTSVNAKDTTKPESKPAGSRQPTSGELYQKEAAEAERKKKEKKKGSVFYLQSLDEKLIKEHKDTLSRVARFNFRRCCAKPIYGEDLYSVVSIYSTSRPATKGNDFSMGAGSVHCHCCLSGTGSVRLDSIYNHAGSLRQLLHLPTDYLIELEEILKRYVFYVPKVASPGITFSTAHPSPASVVQHERFKASLSSQLDESLDCLHPIQVRKKIQFPELRLIQYDCGKLQALDVLLKKLKAGSHRVLIFTQMAKVLDVLERFLNYHGHIYLRLDGATKVEHRQILMERFNADKRIFCFILSTRSGGIGVNLTGADTVIFYDSDWNPTMDAQAQDRCHRIGQTRDVHIYRLVSEMTVEENIIKKANQKRLLADVSIDGGNFTTAFFRKNTICDLFDVPGESSQPEKQDLAKVSQEVATPEEKPLEQISQKDLEQALAKAEDESDVRAATMAHAEQDAELAEFDESIPYEGEEKKEGEEGSKVEMELAQLDNQLTPIEKYAVKYMETSLEPITSEQLKEAEEMIQEAKKEWELGCLQVMTTEAEKQAEMEEDDIFFTYEREDATNKVYISQMEEVMPIWAPPTPPQDDNDVYIDHSMMLMYEQSTMTESQLPPVYIKKESKRIKVEHLRVKVKSHKPEQPHVQTPSVMTPPQSLFNRPSTALLRMRRELAKQQQIRSMAGKPTVKPFVQRPTSVDVHVQDKPEWLINEDWALLQAVQTLQELPLALQPLIPGHTINWDLVSDIVNSCSRIYRSPKQCKIRYENVIIPREEGKILYDSNPKKQKKNKNIYRTKSNRPMKTGQLHAQDSNASHSGLFNSKFDGMKAAIAKRTPFCKQVLNNPLLKNPKHSAVLNEMNISYDKPMTPSQVAAKRAERIAKEKKQQQEQQQQRLQAAAVAAAAAKAQQQQQQQQQQQKQAQAAKAVVQPAGSGTTATVMGTAIARGTIPTMVPAIRGTGGSSIVVNTSSTGTGGVTFATINKRMTQQLTPVVSAAAGITGPTVAGTLAQVVRSQGVRTTIPVTAIITTQAGRTTAAQVVSSVYTTSAQQPRAATAPSQTVTSAQLKSLGSVQIAFLRQQQQQLKRAKIQQQAHAQAQAVQAQAQAQAQAAQQPVQLQALTKVVSPSVSTSGTTITQQQLSALQQQQLAQKLRSPEIQALLKQQALRASKGLPTVKGLTVSSVSSVASQVLSQAQAQIKQQAVTVATQPGTLKTLTLPQGTTVSGATGAAGTTTQKVNFLQLVQMPKQHQKVGGGQQQQLSLSRVQQVTTPGQPATQNATLVQRVVTSQVRPQVQTVRQQLQNQVKRNQGTTLSIQQAGKPVTIIPHGASVLTASPKVSTTSGQQFTQLVAHPKQVLTQLVQQSGQTSTSPQLARIISQPAVTSLQQAKQQVQQSQQNVTQAIIIQEEAPNTTPNTIAATTQLASTSAAPSNLTVITQPQQKAPTTTVAAISVPSTPTVQQVTKEPEAVEEVVEEVGEEQSSPKETPGTVRTSPYAMRLRKPSQSGGQ